MNKPSVQTILIELEFTASRSGGPGGQNVNKVNTKITLRWNIAQSKVLNEDQRSTLIKKLASRINKDGCLILTAQEKRSQIQNKDAVLEKFDALLVRAFTERKPRKPTKPGKAAKNKRLQSKKLHSEKKQWRSRNDD